MKQITTPVPLLYCPTRRCAENYQYTAGPGPIINCELPKDWLVTKSDYVANCGDQNKVEFDGGPRTLAAAADGSYKWPISGSFTGIVFVHSRITVAQVRDGVSKTLLFGEKYLDKRHYTDGKEWGDNEPATAGGDNDTLRTGSVAHPPAADSANLTDWGFRFGSAHAQQFHPVFCDGSVHGVGYEIDAKTFANLCNRTDGQTTNSTAIQ